jgi:hypothetical protein
LVVFHCFKSGLALSGQIALHLQQLQSSQLVTATIPHEPLVGCKWVRSSGALFMYVCMHVCMYVCINTAKSCDAAR